MDNNKKVLSEIIKRQMAILGTQITLDRVKRVPGIQVDQNGDVQSITGDPQLLMQELINQFVELSGLIVKKTMESILSTHPNDMVVVGQAQQGASANLVQAVDTPNVQNQGENLAQIPIVASIHQGASESRVVDNTPKSADNNIQSATRDIEDLNKMLNTQSKT